MTKTTLGIYHTLNPHVCTLPDSVSTEPIQKVVAEAIAHFCQMDIKDWEFLTAMAEISEQRGNEQKARAWRNAAQLLHHFIEGEL
jgi:hypothetical protein